MRKYAARFVKADKIPHADTIDSWADEIVRTVHPFDAGISAYRSGKRPGSHDHPAGSFERMAWESGYSCAAEMMPASWLV